MLEFSLENQLQYKLIYAIIVAGKSAKFAEGAMARLRQELSSRACLRSDWFSSIKVADINGLLGSVVRAARLGNYQKSERALRDLSTWSGDLQTCTAEELEKIHGVGMKTSRFFLRWTARRDRFAVLDVHILRWLKEYGHDVPQSTPQSEREYKRVEKLFLYEADLLGMHPVDLDMKIWLERNKSGIRE